MEPNLFSSGALAKKLDTSRTTVHRLEAEGILPASKRIAGIGARVFEITDLTSLTVVKERIAQNKRARGNWSPLEAA